MKRPLDDGPAGDLVRVILAPVGAVAVLVFLALTLVAWTFRVPARAAHQAAYWWHRRVVGPFVAWGVRRR